MKTSTSGTETLSNDADLNFDREDWASAYSNVETELKAYPLRPTRGTIPRGLTGTFFRNGPGRLERNNHWVHHPFDGDGMISSITFANGQASFTNKFVRTEEWREEEEAGRFLYRGVFGTQKEGGILANAFDVRLKNIANTNVVQLGEKLLALWEASSPYALDPITLETIGVTTLDGVLSPGEAFSAHPRFDPGHNKSPRMVTFGVKTGPKSTIRLMEFATTGDKAGELLHDRKDSFNGFAFLHDFVITPNWAIFLQNSINFNPLPFLLGQKGAAQCLSSNKKNSSKFWFIPRDCGLFAGEQPRIFDAPAGFVFHHLNAYEKGNDVIIDSIHYRDFPSVGPNQDFRKVNFAEFPEGILKRCSINLKTSVIFTEEISNQCCEFAMVNPSKQGLEARYAWMAVAERKEGNGPLQGIKKIDLVTKENQIWSAAPRGFVSEPIMIPLSTSIEEDNGWIICFVWNGERKSTDLIILNSETLNLQALIELPVGIPHGLHGSWVSSA